MALASAGAPSSPRGIPVNTMARRTVYLLVASHLGLGLGRHGAGAAQTTRHATRAATEGATTPRRQPKSLRNPDPYRGGVRDHEESEREGMSTTSESEPPRRSPGRGDGRALLAVYILAILVSVSLVAISVRHRLGYPYDDNPQAAQLIATTARLTEHEPIFKTSAHYVPEIYLPLFYHVANLVMAPKYHELPRLRLLMVLLTLACCPLIALIARALGAGPLPAVSACGAFIGLYWHTGTQFVGASRPDMLALLLLLAGSLLLVWRLDARSWWPLVLGGLCFAGAFLAKQQYLVAAVFWLIPVAQRRGCLATVVLAVSLAVGSGVGLAAMAAYHGDGLWFYCFYMPSVQPLAARQLLVALRAFIYAAPLLAYLLFAGSRFPGWRILLWPTVGAVAAGTLGYLKPGGCDNNCLMAATYAAIMTAPILTQSMADRSTNARAMGYALLIANLIILSPGPAMLLRDLPPTATNRALATELAEVVQELPGDTTLLDRTYQAAVLAGKKPSPVHFYWYTNWHWSGRPPANSVTDALRNGYYDSLVLYYPLPPDVPVDAYIPIAVLSSRHISTELVIWLPRDTPRGQREAIVTHVGSLTHWNGRPWRDHADE